MKKTLAALALLLASAAAPAQIVTGNDLLRYLEDDSLRLPALTFIVGTVKGARVGAGLSGGERLFCIPDEVDAGQVRDTVRAALRRVPEKRHESAELIVVTVVQVTWPCAAKQRPQRGGSSL